jgi:hypothetical protein
LNFSIKQLEDLQKAGKIRGITEKAKKYSGNQPKNIPVKKGNKTKDWISINLKAWCDANKLELLTELKFHSVRKWRFDWALPGIKVAIEYEGLAFKKTGHTTSEGYTANTEKYNAAAAMGWKILRYTYLNYKSVITDLEKLV